MATTATPEKPSKKASAKKAPAKKAPTKKASATSASSARRAAPRPAPTSAQSARKASRGRSLPGWSDLDATGVAGRTGRGVAGHKKATQLADRKADRPRVRAFDAVPSLRFGLLVLLTCVVGTLFVAHVYATRATLAELQDARRDNERLRLAGQRLRGDFDRMTGPDAVMPRARALGLEEGIAYGVPIHINAQNGD